MGFEDDMGFQGGFEVGVKMAGSRMERKDREVVSEVIGVDSGEDDSSGRVRLEVS